MFRKTPARFAANRISASAQSSALGANGHGEEEERVCAACLFELCLFYLGYCASESDYETFHGVRIRSKQT